MSERLSATPVLDTMSQGYHGRSVTLQPKNGLSGPYHSIGSHACRQKRRVRFATAATLINELFEAMMGIRAFAPYDSSGLLIISQTTLATLRRVFSRAAQFRLMSPKATEVKVPFGVTLP